VLVSTGTVTVSNDAVKVSERGISESVSLESVEESEEGTSG
jgi:hypothetical protein